MYTDQRIYTRTDALHIRGSIRTWGRSIAFRVTRRTMTDRLEDSISSLLRRLAAFYPQEGCAWARFYQPRRERRNFASRYHLVYPALGYYLLLRRRPGLAATIRPILDVMYRGLLQPRCWDYWHRELSEAS